MDKMICVVGAGYWGRNHIKSLDKLGSLSGVVDVNKNTLRKIKLKFPEISTHQSIEEAFRV